MENRKELKNRMQLVSDLGGIVQAYEEIYTNQMRQIRESVMKNRNYIEGLTDIYHEMKTISAYKERKAELMGDSSKSTELANDIVKPITLLITGNRRFSGEINQKVFRFFKLYYDEHKGDVAIIGRIGKELFTQTFPKKEYKYFPLDGDILSVETMRSLVEVLEKYTTVEIFYGKFMNLVQQVESQTQINIQEVIPEDVDPSLKKPPEYLFEPNFEKILNFFETQVFGSLVEQTATESKLAQIGARVTAMEEATTNIQSEQKRLDFALKKIIRHDKNKKQLQRLAGINLWR